MNLTLPCSTVLSRDNQISNFEKQTDIIGRISSIVIVPYSRTIIGDNIQRRQEGNVVSATGSCSHLLNLMCCVYNWELFPLIRFDCIASDLQNMHT